MTHNGYRNLEGINWSALRHMDTSPKHYRHALEAPDKDTDAMKVGRALHTAVLEPDRLGERVATWTGEDRRTKAGKVNWALFAAASVGKDILTREQRDRVAAMAAAVRCDEAASYYIQHQGDVEVPIQWRDYGTQQLCKARLDKIAGCVVDLKSGRDITPWRFATSAARYHYHGQLAYYHDGLKIARPDLELGPPVIIAVESVPPYDVAVYTCEALLKPGRELYQRLLERLAECRLTNTWPGCCPCPMPLELPVWMQDDEGDGLDWEEDAA